MIQLFEQWGLSEKEQLSALGYSTSDGELLSRYRAGDAAIASVEDLERAHYLVSIQKSLLILFPRKGVAKIWMHRPNAEFDNMTPATVIGEPGLDGLALVLAHLERAL